MLSIVHISAKSSVNAGDIFLSESVKRLFERKLGGIEWIDFDLKDTCTEADIEMFNRHDAVVIGGGGNIALNSFYFKEDTGWSVGIPEVLIPKLKTKLIGYAMGYNLFRGEVMDNSVFTSNISKMIDASSFFSLRHRGDIKKLKEVIGDSCDVRLNFCSSMVSYEFRPNDLDKVAFQFAWDAVENRFGSQDNVDKFIQNMLVIAKRFIDDGKKVCLVSHTNRDVPMDKEVFEKWNDAGITCELVSLVGAEPKTTADFYYGINTVFAMRGHSQMIPMGLGCKVVSLISHDKMKHLLEDMGIEETGVEVNEVDFIKKCMKAYCDVQSIDMKDKMKIVSSNIDSNMEKIKTIMEL